MQPVQACGSSAPDLGNAVCALCAPGKFQPARGQTACVDCTPGNACIEGSMLAAPCPGGTHAN
eukprot:4077179-Prymnesium_polylepis.1